MYQACCLGPTVPLIAVFDCHANLNQTMVDQADMLIGYDTYLSFLIMGSAHQAAILSKR